MWPWKKKDEPAFQDTTDAIFIGGRAFPLMCDNMLYLESLKEIKRYIADWVHQEEELISAMGDNGTHSLIRTFSNVDIRNLGWPDALAVFLQILEDTAITKEGARFEDLVLRLCINIPTEVLETITGKFLYGVLYKNRQQINKRQVPTKEAWEFTLTAVPWLPLLPIVQEVLDQEQAIQRLANKATSATVLRPSILPGGSTN